MLKIAVEICKQLGRDVKLIGDWVMTNCPFAPYTHSKGTDRNPSFGINYKTAAYNCFSCGKHGSLYTLPYELKRLSGEDYSWLVNLLLYGNTIRVNFSSKRSKKLIPMNDLLELFQPLLLEYKYIDQQLGAIYNVLAYEDMVIFPVIDISDNVIAFKARNRNSNKSFYLKELEGIKFPDNKPKLAGIWYLENMLNIENDVVLVEGERDAILTSFYLMQLGVSVLGSLGAKITQEQIKRLKRLVSGKVVIAFDNDEAGNSAKKEVIKGLKKTHELYEIKDWFGLKDPAEAYEKGKLQALLSKKNLKEV